MATNRLVKKGSSQECKFFIYETYPIFIYEPYIRDNFQIGTHREVPLAEHVIM